jgi:hypothetical protein
VGAVFHGEFSEALGSSGSSENWVQLLWAWPQLVHSTVSSEKRRVPSQDDTHLYVGGFVPFSFLSYSRLCLLSCISFIHSLTRCFPPHLIL